MISALRLRMRPWRCWRQRTGVSISISVLTWSRSAWPHTAAPARPCPRPSWRQRALPTASSSARQRRGRITVVGKRHILPVTDGLFFNEVKNEAVLHPSVTWREMDIDAMAADLYTRPGDHDVILTTNMFGDMLSNEALALSGSLGLAGSLNMGECHAAANAGHGSAPDIPGPGTANPTRLMLSAAMLLRWLCARHQLREFLHAAANAESAAAAAMLDPGSRTADLGGSAKTQVFTKAVIRSIRE